MSLSGLFFFLQFSVIRKRKWEGRERNVHEGGEREKREGKMHTCALLLFFGTEILFFSPITLQYYIIQYLKNLFRSIRATKTADPPLRRF